MLIQEAKILTTSIQNLIRMSEEIAIDHSEIISTIFENENKTSWAYFFPFVFSNHLPP